MNKEHDPITDTWMLIEEYEYQANILAGHMLANNKLFRLRVSMHDKIHEILGKEDCEFCFYKEEIDDAYK